MPSPKKLRHASLLPPDRELVEPVHILARDRQWLKDLAVGFVPEKFHGSMVEYFDSRLRLPHSTRYPVYVAHESPWLMVPMTAMCDLNIRRVDLRMPAGAAKSLVGEMHIAWCIENEPGLYYYVHQTDPDGADAMEDRIYPMIEANDFLNRHMPVDRHKRRNSKIVFPHMSLYCVGANLGAAQSKRVKFLTMEEPHMYKPGMMSAFEKRCEGVRNAKILTLSTGSIRGDDSDVGFLTGSCEEWEVPCPHCDTYQAMTDDKDRLVFDRNDDTIDANGQYVWNAILPTVKYLCAHCNLPWPKDEATRRDQSARGRYRVTNPNAPDNHRSFHMEAVSVHYFDLSKILMEKLNASYAARAGQLDPLKDYVQKRRAMAWDEAPSDADNDQDFARMKGEYALGDAFDGEIARFMTIDNQHGRASKGEGAHRWYVCRAYGQQESRIISEGRITTWEELEELRIALGVEPGRTLVDIAFDTQATQEVCVRYGWQGLWGDHTNRSYYPHHEEFNGQKVLRKLPFSSVNVGHVGIGQGGVTRQARYYFWCQQAIKNTYHRLRSGLSSYRITVPQDISTEYRKQTGVEFKRQEIQKDGSKVWKWVVARGRQNHLLDCDQMSLVSAMLDPRLRVLLFTTADEVANAAEQMPARPMPKPPQKETES